MPRYVVFASFEVEAESEEAAMNGVNEEINHLDALTEVWVHGEFDSKGDLI